MRPSKILILNASSKLLKNLLKKKTYYSSVHFFNIRYTIFKQKVEEKKIFLNYVAHKI